MGTHSCLTCGKGFPNRPKLSRHMEVHMARICEKCNLSFHSYSKLRRHAAEAHRKGYRCSFCNMRFPYKGQTLLSHILTHSKKKDLVYCPYDGCEKHYSRVSNLRQHIFTQHHRRRYNCPGRDCSRCFCTAQSLQRHLRSCVCDKPSSPPPTNGSRQQEHLSSESLLCKGLLSKSGDCQGEAVTDIKTANAQLCVTANESKHRDQMGLRRARRTTVCR